MSGWNGYSEKGQGSQERGPGTFTFAPPATPQAQGSNAVMAKAGYKTVESVGGLSTYNEQGDKTAAALFGFAETMLKPVAQEVAARKFLEGQQRAASGEALTQIVNEQPWYSKIFGPSSAVEGARQYSLDAQAAKFDVAVQNAMPKLRNTSPDELPAIIQKMSKEFQTGDPQTDVQLGLRLTKVLPNLIQAQTREFYKAQQEHADNQRFEAAQQNAAALQRVSQNAMASDDDKQLRQANFLQGLVLAAGVDPESHKQFVATLLPSLAEAGQFHAVNLAINSGAMQSLSPEKRLQVARAVTQSKKQHASEAREDYSEQIDKIKFQAAYGVDGRPMAGQEVEDAVKALNSNYSKRTGNDTPVVNAAQKSSLMLTAAQSLMMANREALQAAKAQAQVVGKQTAIELEQAAAKDAVMNTNTQAAINAGHTQKYVDDAFMGLFQQIVGSDRGLQKPGTIQGVAKLLTTDAVGGRAVESVKAAIGQYINLSTDSLTDNFEKGVAIYEALQAAHPTLRGLDNPAIAAYFTPKQLRVISAYRAEVKSIPDGIDPKAREVRKGLAFQLANSIPGGEAIDFNKNQQASFDALFTKHARGNSWTGSDLSERYAGVKSGFLSKGWFGNPEPVPYAKQLVQQAAQSYYAEMKGRGLNDGERMSQAVQRAMADSELYGRYAWPKSTGRNTLVEDLTFSPYADGVPFDKVQLAAGLNTLLEQRIRAVTDKDPDNVWTIRLPDAGGDQRFRAVVMVEGDVRVVEFSGSEVAITAKKARAKAPTDNIKTATEQGPSAALRSIRENELLRNQRHK